MGLPSLPIRRVLREKGRRKRRTKKKKKKKSKSKKKRSNDSDGESPKEKKKAKQDDDREGLDWRVDMIEKMKDIKSMSPNRLEIEFKKAMAERKRKEEEERCILE